MALNDVIMQLSLRDHHPWTKCPSLEPHPDTPQLLCHSASHTGKPQRGKASCSSLSALQMSSIFLQSSGTKDWRCLA